MDPALPRLDQRKKSTIDINGKPIMPLCKKCGIPVIECIEAKTHPVGTLDYCSNNGRFKRYIWRVKQQESGIIEPRAKAQTADDTGKPIMPPCKKCGIPVIECIEAKTHPSYTPVYYSNLSRLRIYLKRLEQWESGVKFKKNHQEGRQQSPEARAKISIANKNKVFTAQTRDKISASLMGVNVGLKQSEETKAKRRATQVAIGLTEKVAQSNRNRGAIRRMAALTKIS